MNTPPPENPPAFLLRSRRIVTPHREIDGAVEIRNDVIAAIHAADQIPSGLPMEDLGHLALLPGLVDAHVHINEPGRTDWEGFGTATRAALDGGIALLLDMPLNSSPVSITAEALRQKRAAVGNLNVDIGFYGGLVRGNAHRMRELIDEGVFGIKAFLCDSGLDEFQAATEEDLRQAMPVLAAAGVPLLVHAELPRATPYIPADPCSHAEWLASRPPEMELAAIEMMIRLARETRCMVQIVHLSTADALPMLAAAQRDGLPIVVETCPHYLFFDAEAIAHGDTRFKCAPPIRNAENRERLWQGLRNGIITRIASDHSPCPPDMKALDSGDFFRAWGGISSLQLTLPVVWTEARRRGISLPQVCNWLNGRTIPTLAPQLPAIGLLEPGSAANLVAFDPDQATTVRGSRLKHRHKITPYEGQELFGTIRAVWKQGRCAFLNGETTSPRAGRILFTSDPKRFVTNIVAGPRNLPAQVESETRNRVASHPLTPATLDGLNKLSEDTATELFYRCCGSPVWAINMARSRPYPNSFDLYANAAFCFEALLQTRNDWLAPFSNHPRIGDIDSLRKKFTRAEQEEQSSSSEADEKTLRALAEGNIEYEKKFGYIFIVCATGKSADEMLAILRDRLKNAPDEEWRIAAEEQKKITYLRLAKTDMKDWDLDQ